MNKRRLLKLADLLDENAKNKKGIRYNHGRWGTIANENEPVSCGTQACALGLAAISGAFRRNGLGYKVNDTGWVSFTIDKAPHNPLYAANKIFDVDERLYDRIFVNPPRNTKGVLVEVGAQAEKAVARNIRKIVAAAP